eukprot:CAMPEP_0176358664 /NCGR_PEP_ID=MMETSP0126-20121128/15747_1 /TAXON_ID=141414 ORGANISM="Strombidinopsis acuminatum, Strain SPMC142" /NCGR_SAMPLE_ID=MMETSP0126 /ASSEMBLY_ACC=CAM_ASM_000229 /LENGTH=63 /DNA_ID=CAMNT_0017712993 /DNA_START=2540 /DNA_END=2731 /DNA_ORIENTATION=+
MEDGCAVEYDHPYNLLTKGKQQSNAINNDEAYKKITNTDGYFAKMVLATGNQSANALYEIAES